MKILLKKYFMHKEYLVTGAILAATAVALGAFGAHGLQNIVSDETIIQNFRTGVLYQMIHALAVIATGIIFMQYPNKKVQRAGFCFITGILFFSGSLYLITILKIAGKSVTGFIGLLTPLGGLFLIAGWLMLVWGILDNKN